MLSHPGSSNTCVVYSDVALEVNNTFALFLVRVSKKKKKKKENTHILILLTCVFKIYDYIFWWERLCLCGLRQREYISEGVCLSIPVTTFP